MSATEQSKYKKRGDELIAAYESDRNAIAAQNKAEVDTQIDAQITKAEENTARKQTQLGEDYRGLVDTVAVQREIDRRQISETMANMGLSKSGLSATQQTAVQLSAGNKMAAADRQRQAAVDSLTRSLAEYRMKAEDTRRTSKNSIDAEAQKDIADYTQSINKTVTDAETAEYTAEQERIAAVEKAKQDAIVKKAQADAEALKERGKILKTLYDNGEISPNTYTLALESGLTPSQALSYEEKNHTPAENTPKEPWSWSSASYRKTGNDTTNGLWGIDRNDTVEYFDENGKLQTISLIDLRNKLQSEDMSRKDANAFVNQFNDDDGTNTSYFLTKNGSKNYAATVSDYAQKAYNLYGKDGVLTELTAARAQRVISDDQFVEIANRFDISEEDYISYNANKYENPQNISKLLEIKGAAYERYGTWE